MTVRKRSRHVQQYLENTNRNIKSWCTVDTESEVRHFERRVLRQRLDVSL